MAEVTLSIPFTVNPYGTIDTTINQSKIWADRVRSVLGTTLRERVMRPTLGTIIPFSLFNSEESAVAEIRAEVNKAFGEQLKLLTLEKVNVTSDQYTNVLNIEVIYGLPNDEVVSTIVGLVRIDGANPIYEESL
jgi:phage baseplate assembly protein W